MGPSFALWEVTAWVALAWVAALAVLECSWVSAIVIILSLTSMNRKGRGEREYILVALVVAVGERAYYL